MNTDKERKNKMSNVTKEKYTIFLSEVYAKIQDNNYLNMHSISCDFKIGRHVPTILLQQNIIKKIGKSKYIWIGKKPSLQMVNLIIEKSRIYCSESKYKAELEHKKTGQQQIYFKKPVEKSLVKIINPSTEVKEQKQNYSFSILWGLIKIQKS